MLIRDCRQITYVTLNGVFLKLLELHSIISEKVPLLEIGTWVYLS